MGDSIFAKNRQDIKQGRYVVVRLPRARIKHVTESVDREHIWAWPERIYISTCRDEQYRQGWDNYNSAEIQTIVRETEEDKS